MIFYKPNNLNQLFEISEKFEGRKYFLAGGSDINVQIKKGLIKDEPLIFINHLKELKGIQHFDDQIIIGALNTFQEILNSDLIKQKFPFFQRSLKNFASPLLQSIATIGGNIANGSPTADVVPLLLVLDAKLKLFSKSKIRVIPINEFYRGYKQFNLNKNEIIGAVSIPENAESGYETFYRKIGSRKSLYIAKIALAGLKKISNEKIIKVKFAAGSLNEYPRRLKKLESYLINKNHSKIEKTEIKEVLLKEITPISDLRSDKDYRFEVCLNLINIFLNT
ncbi:MAG TPA: hypothetical protein ENL20_11200 [Candidatus Cloacimonetes bacterium]|nr:hypothetical protein [Candidatus Cloacimonadota bacterium]